MYSHSKGPSHCFNLQRLCRNLNRRMRRSFRTNWGRATSPLVRLFTPYICSILSPLEKGVRIKLQHGAKRYVDVISRRYADGHVEFLIICWPDGRSFQVEHVVGKPQSSTFPGSAGRVLHYTIMIEGVRTQFFLEIGREGAGDASR